MIKGRYVATIIIDLEFDEKECEEFTFDELKDEFHRFTPNINEMIQRVIGNDGTVHVEQQYADFYRTEKE